MRLTATLTTADQINHNDHNDHNDDDNYDTGTCDALGSTRIALKRMRFAAPADMSEASCKAIDVEAKVDSTAEDSCKSDAGECDNDIDETCEVDSTAEDSCKSDAGEFDNDTDETCESADVDPVPMPGV